MNERKSTRKHKDFLRSWIGNRSRIYSNDAARPPMVKLKKWQLVIIGLLLGLLYGAVTLNFSLSLQVYYLLCLAGLIIIFRQPQPLLLSEGEKIGLMVIVIFCLISIFTFWVNGMPGKGSLYVQGRHGKFLLAIPIYYVFRNYYIPNRLICILAIFVSLELLIIAIIDQSTNSVFGWPGRASGNTHPIYFGIQALMMAVIILALHDEWSQKRILGLLAKFSLAAAVIALIMTGSRSVWLALPVIGILYMASRTEKVNMRYAFRMIAIVLASTVLLYQLPPVKDRWNEAIQEFHDYQLSESVDDPARLSSLGARLEMWRAARLMILDNPVLGVGTGGFQITATKYYENGGWSNDLPTRNGPHNQYLNSWASRGIIGLIATVLILVGPFIYCLRVRKESSFQDVRQLALACMMIVVIFAISGLSEDTLEKKPLIILYLTSLTVMLGQIRHRLTLSS